jgi:hypothetical protein
MRALKALVIFMGVLLVGGLVALIIAIAVRFSEPQPTTTTPRPGFGTATVSLPTGARILSVQTVGNRLIVQVALPDSSQRLVVVDPGSGTVVGTIELRPGS